VTFTIRSIAGVLVVDALNTFHTETRDP